MSGRGGGGSQTTKVEPWSGAQPYLRGGTEGGSGKGGTKRTGILPEAERLYNEGGYGAVTQQGIDRLATPTQFNIDPNAINPYTTGDTVFARKATDLIDRGTGTDFMSAYGDDILDSVDSRYAKAGRTGSGYHVDTAAKELGGVASRLHSEDRNRELQAAAMYNMMDQQNLDAVM